MKKVPERTCIGCNQIKPKNELIRIVKDKENIISVDLTGKKNGRGAYLCLNIDCLEKAMKTKRLSKVLNYDIDKKIYEELRDVIDSQSK